MHSWSDAAGADAYPTVPAALVIADCGDSQTAADALAAAGWRVSAHLHVTDAAAQLESGPPVDLIVLEAGGIAEPALEPLLAAASARGAAIVATLDLEQLDLAAALLGTRAQLLCRPTPAERLCAFVLAKPAGHAALHEASRDDHGARMLRLNEDVARIAEALARLTRGEEPLPTALREPEPGYRGPEDALSAETSPHEIRATIRARRMRERFFAGDLFADPAWDMLLDLFAAALERRSVSVSSLCIAAAVPPTTALRWIGALHDVGLFERQADPSDRRRAYVALTPKGLHGMQAYAAAVKRAGLPIV